MVDNYGCHCNCSEPPESLYPYPDISGVGVLVGYTATAGIVVLILVLHYYLAHDPKKDPFRKENEPESSNPRPNPIDVVFLGFLHKLLSWSHSSTNSPTVRARPRWEAAFIKCVQSMSDLQILTGMSILISGYVQLQCGLSTFHWQIIVLLAWFSSITHLCCLTFLRNYLYNRPGERVWRLVAMGLIVFMLLVAMVPTGGYNWTYDYYDREPIPAPHDYAICYFRPSGNDEDWTFSTMVISAILLTLGFIYRVIRLHKSLSVSIIGQARSILSEKARDYLLRIYKKTDMETSGLTWKRLFLYRPVLSFFLTLRALLDLWNSMFIEILWMVGSFIWGLLRLLQTVQIDDGSSSDWSFGQVVPIVLLTAPLLTIFETFFQDQVNTTDSTEIVQIHAASLPSNHSNTSPDTTLQQRDHPNRGFYQESDWTCSLIYFMVAHAIGTTIQVLVLSGFGNMKLVQLLIPTVIFPSYRPFYAALSILVFIALSMLLEDIGSAQGDVLKYFMGMKRKNFIRWCRTVSAVFSLTGAFLIIDLEPITICFVGANIVMYCVFSVVVVRHKNAFL